MPLHGPSRFATVATALLNLMRGYLVGYDRGLEVGPSVSGARVLRSMVANRVIAASLPSWASRATVMINCTVMSWLPNLPPQVSRARCLRVVDQTEHSTLRGARAVRGRF